MKKISVYVLAVFVLASMLLGACTGTTAPSAAKVNAAPVAYTGTIESIDGNQWVVNGQAITVDPSVVKDGPYNVGDVVKIEVEVSQDGSVSVTRVEQPTEEDLSQLPEIGDDNSNDDDANANDDNSNDSNSNDDNSNDVNSNDDDINSNDANSNDDSSNANVNDSNSNDDNSNDDDVITNDSNSNDDSSSNDDASNDSNSNSDSSHDSNDDNSNDSNSNSNSNG